jgi:methylase of polypeptide subunit release factors
VTRVELRVAPSGEPRVYRFQSETDPPPQRVEVIGDQTNAGHALRALRVGTHLLYEGDERNARQLLQALVRRAIGRRKPRPDTPVSEIFHRARAARLDEHRVLSRLLIELGPGWTPKLRRPSDVSAACEAALGAWTDGENVLCPLREVMGIVGAWEWQRRGIEIPALGGRIHPRWGVFAPTRRAYVDLVATAPMPPTSPRAFDLGTGTGVLGLVLARRGAREVVATDVDPRAVACATDNAERLDLGARFRAELADLWPAAPKKADLIVFNPPWVPGAPRSRIERAIFDPRGALLERFLREVPEHLEADGQAWLVMSDLAERLGMRENEHVRERAEANGLSVAWSRSAPASGAAERRGAAAEEEDLDVVASAKHAEHVVLWCLVASQPR